MGGSAEAGENKSSMSHCVYVYLLMWNAECMNREIDNALKGYAEDNCAGIF